MSAHRSPRESARSHAPILLGVALGSLTVACELDLEPTPMEYGLQARTIDKLQETYVDLEVAKARILGALEMLFGTPQEPFVLRTAQWVEDEIEHSNARGFELSEAAWNAVVAGNDVRFERQIELIEAGRYEEVYEPRNAEDLWADWEKRVLPALLENPDEMVDPDDEGLGTWKDEALYIFKNNYPTLRESAEMYRRECLHCHGVSGGGDGPTAPYLDPRPRDYRHGKFKWIETKPGEPPRREDLLHILEEGSVFTAMPSFRRFSRGELEGLVDYVRLLSVRGMVEFRLAFAMAANDGILTEADIFEAYEDIWEQWDTAYERHVSFDGDVPLPTVVTKEYIAEGRELFLGELAACSTCHGEDGRGDGVSLLEPDPDAEPIVDENGVETPVLRVKLDDWGNPSAPRNFKNAIFRGGGRPIDLYRRIKGGISGTIMPAAADDLADEDIWKIVYYVRSVANEHDVARLTEAKAARHAGEEAGGQ